MTRLDRYLLRTFLSSALFALVTFVLIFIVVNMLEQLDDFIDKGLTGAQVALYYIYFIPDITRLLIPVALLLASLYAIGRLAQLNELTAMKASGVSLYRLLRPLLIAAVVISAADVYFDAWVVPRANRLKFSFERQTLNRQVIAGIQDNLVFRDSPTTFIDIVTYESGRSKAHTVTIARFDTNDATHMVERIDAAMMEFDSTRRVWVLTKGMRRVFRQGGDSARGFEKLDLATLRATPSDLRSRQTRTDEMNFVELGDFLERERRTGRNISTAEVAYYDKLAFPFASFIVVLFGAALASERRRSGLAVQVGIALGVAFTYLALSRIVQTIGAETNMHPAIIAWFTNILFLIAGIINVLRVRT